MRLFLHTIRYCLVHFTHVIRYRFIHFMPAICNCFRHCEQPISFCRCDKKPINIYIYIIHTYGSMHFDMLSAKCSLYYDHYDFRIPISESVRQGQRQCSASWCDIYAVYMQSAMLVTQAICWPAPLGMRLPVFCHKPITITFPMFAVYTYFLFQFKKTNKKNQAMVSLKCATLTNIIFMQCGSRFFIWRNCSNVLN